jgi:Rab11 family-interacting protein 3/4
MLEEHIREIEVRGEERLLEEQRRNKDLVQRLEREKQLEIENYSIRLQGMEKDQRVLTEEVTNLRAQLDKTREEKNSVEEQLSETQILLMREQEQHRLLQDNRAREVEEWGSERATSLNIVQEMSREVSLKTQRNWK